MTDLRFAGERGSAKTAPRRRTRRLFPAYFYRGEPLVLFHAFRG